MKLTIKELAPYLPYGLKMQYVVREKVEKTGIMKSIIHNEDETHPTKVSIEWGDAEHIWMFKPILHPLSDLTKEIEVNGEKFVPIKVLRDKGFHVSEEWIEEGFNDVINSNYEFVQLLLEWHFDVFDLHSKNLCVLH